MYQKYVLDHQTSDEITKFSRKSLNVAPLPRIDSF